MAVTSLWSSVCANRVRVSLWNVCAVAVCLLLSAAFLTSMTDHDLRIGPHTAYIQPPSQTKPEATGPSQILLATNGRSGSSFTSAILNNNSDVFYLFEPLFALYPAIKKESVDRIREESTGLVESFLNCNFSSFNSTVVFENSQFRNSGKYVRHFWSCMKSTAQGFKHLGCFLEFIKGCRKSKITFVKVIRFQLHWAADLMSKNPKLKLLYLIRDPRAVMHSQARVFKNFRWPQDIDLKSRSYCNSLRNDMEQLDLLDSMFPGRVKGLRYETGALQPVSYAKDIYRFAGLEFTNQTFAFITSMTNATEKDHDNRPFSIQRSNSSQPVVRWRYNAGFNTVKIVDNNCHGVYPFFGYVTAKSQADLESDRPLFAKPMSKHFLSDMYDT